MTKAPRLGMGSGYYDRTLAYHKPKLSVGVAHAFQQYPHLKKETWDVPLQLIVTEEGIKIINSQDKG